MTYPYWQIYLEDGTIIDDSRCHNCNWGVQVYKFYEYGEVETEKYTTGFWFWKKEHSEEIQHKSVIYIFQREKIKYIKLIDGGITNDK